MILLYIKYNLDVIREFEMLRIFLIVRQIYLYEVFFTIPAASMIIAKVSDILNAIEAKIIDNKNV